MDAKPATSSNKANLFEVLAGINHSCRCKRFCLNTVQWHVSDVSTSKVCLRVKALSYLTLKDVLLKRYKFCQQDFSRISLYLFMGKQQAAQQQQQSENISLQNLDDIGATGRAKL